MYSDAFFKICAREDLSPPFIVGMASRRPVKLSLMWSLRFLSKALWWARLSIVLILNSDKFLKCVITSNNVNYNIHGQFWCHYCLLSSKKFITLVYLPYWNNYFKTKYDAFCIFWKTEFRNRKVSEMSKIKLFLLCVRSILILLWLDINLTFIFTHFQSVTVSKKEGKKILLKLVATKSRKTQSLSHTFVIMKKKMTDFQTLAKISWQIWLEKAKNFNPSYLVSLVTVLNYFFCVAWPLPLLIRAL